MTNKTRETCDHIGLVYTYIYVFLQNNLRVSEDFQFWVSDSRNN